MFPGVCRFLALAGNVSVHDGTPSKKRARLNQIMQLPLRGVAVAAFARPCERPARTGHDQPTTVLTKLPRLTPH